MRNLETIREEIIKHKGARVFYRASNGRRKTQEHTGVIKDVYPSLFTVFIDSQQNTVSFRYADVLTKEVELKFEENGKSVL